MILSNVEIQKAIDEGRLAIAPDPQPRSGEEPGCPYDTTAVNLRLGNALSIPRNGPFSYDLRQPGIAKFLAQNCDHIDLGAAGGGYVLQPKLFVLGRTLERVALPLTEGQTLAARIEGKSSFARCGLLVHFTAPTIHAGFDGTITLEMINLGNSGICLFAGMQICQLIVETVSGNPQAHPSQFQSQTTPAGTSRT